MTSSTVTNLTSRDLQDYLKAHQEKEFAIVDVRQPEEYESGHIPGARLIPLPELETRSEELRQLSGRDIVVYCRSGGRSARAAQFAALELRLPRVHNLLGGFMGFQGETLQSVPPLKAIDLNGGVEAIIRQALDLEKGTHRLYTALAPALAGTPAERTVRDLQSAEVAHGRVLYDTLSSLIDDDLPSYEALFDQLRGDLIESGEPLEAWVSQVLQSAPVDKISLLELALEIELRAYDLYKSLGAAQPAGPTRDALIGLSQEEKQHVNRVAEAIGTTVARAS